jgi:hypothetical protein
LSIPRVKRLRPKGSEEFVCSFLSRREEVDDTKSARVGVDCSGTIGENELEVVMFATVSGLIAKRRDRNTAVHGPQERFGGGSLVGVKQGIASAHAEVGKQHTPIIKVNEEVFCTPPDVDNGGASKRR